jgi:pyruvate kinase
MENIIEIRPLQLALTDIRNAMLAAERKYQSYIDQVQPHYRDSARNLIHYLALRSFDLRDLQWQLFSLGLSSLGHSERYTMVNLQNILFLLRLLNGGSPVGKSGGDAGLDVNYPRGKRRLDENTISIFGPEEFAGHTRIMVTLPSEAADDYHLVKEMALAGMDVARINCSHDGPEAWLKMIENLNLAKLETGRSILLYMDLEGPKLRTGAIAPKISKKGKEKRGFIRLREGDALYLTPDSTAAAIRPVFGDDGEQLSPGEIGVTLPDVFTDVKAGQHIWFDDGKIGGVVEVVLPNRIEVRITHVPGAEAKLRAEKGINLPDTTFQLPALTASDLENLPLIAAHADLVGYSFVRRPSDVEALQEELRLLQREDIGIILKIETRETFTNLPALLLTAMRSPRIGAMIARGDLAVELGFLRIAEVQEQILWLCEAAHIPTIWATQILESLVKQGNATRAEISDAVLSVRAECAMLNKGPHIVEAIQLLRDIDRRMADHQVKKRSALRPLNVARLFLGIEETLQG